MRKIIISDCTLQKAKELNSQLLFREKLAIALSTEEYGADRVELPAVENIKEDSIINRTIAISMKNATLCIPVGSDENGIKEVYDCVKAAPAVCLQVVLPVSTVQMEYLYHVKAEKMGAKIASMISAAKAYCPEVEFVALDATRADEDFLLAVVQQAQSAGATAITLCDDAGIMLPDEFADFTRKVCKQVSIPVYVEASDKIGVATANAIAALKAGASGIKASVSSKTTLQIGKFVEAIKVKGEAIGVETGLKFTEINHDIEELRKKIKHDPQLTNYTGTKEEVFLDSDSTFNAVIDAVKSLGFDLKDTDYGKVYDEMKRVCDRKGSIGAKELEAIIASSADQAPSTYHLESYIATCGSKSGALAQVVLKNGEELITGIGNGDGPLDSAIKAIEQSIGNHYELDLFQIEAVTEGKEALGSCNIRLRSSQGKLYSGNGISTDIVGASIRAYLNALNKIVYEEK